MACAAFSQMSCRQARPTSAACPLCSLLLPQYDQPGAGSCRPAGYWLGPHISSLDTPGPLHLALAGYEGEVSVFNKSRRIKVESGCCCGNESSRSLCWSVTTFGSHLRPPRSYAYSHAYCVIKSNKQIKSLFMI
jgi:hypothetical protein